VGFKIFPTAQAGTYTVTITATGQKTQKTHTATVTITVTSTFDFSIARYPFSDLAIAAVAGQTCFVDYRLTLVSGTPGPVTVLADPNGPFPGQLSVTPPTAIPTQNQNLPPGSACDVRLGIAMPTGAPMGVPWQVTIYALGGGNQHIIVDDIIIPEPGTLP
jgi:hypothetical protein